MLNTVKYVSSLGLRVHNNLNDFMYIIEIISYYHYFLISVAIHLFVPKYVGE